MEGYLLAKSHKRVLLVDFDPQGNLTQMMGATFNNRMKPSVPLYNGLTHMDLSQSVLHVSDNMDMIPTDWKLSMWEDKVAKYPKQERPYILNHLLMPFRGKYDYIFIDVPPTLTQFVLNAIFASDAISIVLQTQKYSYRSALLTAKELYSLRSQYNLDFKFLGVILYLYQNAKEDREISAKARKVFKGATYYNTIKNQERVKGFTDTGIRNHDHWDRRALKMYKMITQELIYRVDHH